MHEWILCYDSSSCGVWHFFAVPVGQYGLICRQSWLRSVCTSVCKIYAAGWSLTKAQAIQLVTNLLFLKNLLMLFLFFWRKRQLLLAVFMKDTKICETLSWRASESDVGTTDSLNLISARRVDHSTFRCKWFVDKAKR